MRKARIAQIVLTAALTATLTASCSSTEEPSRGSKDGFEQSARPVITPPATTDVASKAVEADKVEAPEGAAHGGGLAQGAEAGTEGEGDDTARLDAERGEGDAAGVGEGGGDEGPAPLRWVDLENSAMVIRKVPDTKADVIGTVRRGWPFPIYEVKDGPGCDEDWARVGPGWVCSEKFVEASGPGAPVAALPFEYGVVYEDTEIHSGPHKYMGTGKMRKRKSTVTIEETTDRWVKTWPDQWLDKRVVGPRIVRTSKLEGVVITPQTELPLAFVRRNYTTAYPEPALSKGDRRKAKAKAVDVGRFTLHKVLESHPKEGRFAQSFRIEVGWLDSHQVGLIEQTPRPDDVGSDEKWILIDLSEQTAVAYEGDRMVYATLISTGKGTNGPESFTPTGKYRINNKLRSARMAGGEGDGYHFLSDVPWVQYFHGGYAMHGVYWHNAFGWPTSQGCVNLTAHDAQWFFEWTGPEMPAGWYSYNPDERGTTIVISN